MCAELISWSFGPFYPELCSFPVACPLEVVAQPWILALGEVDPALLARALGVKVPHRRQNQRLQNHFISLKSLVQSRGGNMMSRFRQGVRSTIASPQNIREKYRNRKTWIGSFAYLLSGPFWLAIRNQQHWLDCACHARNKKVRTERVQKKRCIERVPKKMYRAIKRVSMRETNESG
ncbi:hypothetical protein YC2023_076136 [Brassica napus]